MRSRPMLRPLAALALALAPALAACSDDGSGDDDPTKYNCEADDRDEPFTSGLARTGAGGVTFTIVSADPALPVRGDNTWIVDVAKDGGPLTGVDATLKLTPFMPDHGHSPAVRPVWTPDAAQAGRYTVTPVNLWMPGVWDLTFEATPTGAPRDTVRFRFCVTG